MTARFLAAAGRPLVLGHRGASAAWPENTLRAFQGALADGADGVELDVLRCASGEVVVLHDDDLRRVSGGAPGSERPARAMTLRELRRFDLGGGERVPTLAEVLAALGPAALVNVELKSPAVRGVRDHLRLLADDGLAAATAEVLRQAGRLSGGTTLVSSFDPLQLVRFRRFAGDAVPLGYLCHRQQALPLREAWPARLLRPAALHPEAGLVDAVALRRWRRQGLAVHVWTVDDPREVVALTHLGVDGIITNRPGAVRRLVEELAVSEEAVATSSPPSRAAPSPAPCTPRAAFSRRGSRCP